MARIVHLMGMTGAGKSTLIRRLCQFEPEKVGAIEVGRMLRAKYGEAYFNGQAAPKHTQGEAWDMYVAGVNALVAQKKQLILVDGQPRDIQQARDVEGLWKYPHRTDFVLLHADHETRLDRVKERAKTADNPTDHLALALQRMHNDYVNFYVVTAELLRQGQCIRVIDTNLSPDALAERVLAEYAERIPSR